LIQSLIKNQKENLIKKVVLPKKSFIEKNLSDKGVLEEVLDDLTNKGNVKKLHLLRERLHHKTEVHQSGEIDKENQKLTHVGISLHKQGQVLEHLIREEPPKIQSEQVTETITTSKRTQELLNKKRRLQSILHELKQLAKVKQNIAAIQPTLRLQEKILN